MGPLDDGVAITYSARELARDAAARRQPPTKQPDASRLQALTSTQGTLDLIARTACRCLPGVEQVTICVFNHDGHLDTPTATSKVGHEMHSRLPAPGNSRSGPAAARPAQWRRGQAMEPRNRLHGRRHANSEAALRIRIFGNEDSIGLLTMYAPSVPTVEPRAHRVGELLADHAGLALGRSDRNLDSRSMLVERRAIGQAARILMERYRLDEEGAYEYLVRTCQHSSHLLPDLAREVIAVAGRGSVRVVDVLDVRHGRPSELRPATSGYGPRVGHFGGSPLISPQSVSRGGRSGLPGSR